MKNPSPSSSAGFFATGLKRGLDAVLYSSTWLSLGAVGLTGATFLFWHVPVPGRLALLIFLATLFLYNIDSVLPYKHSQQLVLTARKQWMLRHRRALLGVAVVALVLASGLFWLDGWSYLTGFLGHLALISLLYSLPVVRVRGHWRALRDLPLLKGFLIAYVWTAVTVWLPAYHLHKPLLSGPVTTLFARRFLFILALALLFDIRDYTKDRLSGTRTFPGIVGVPATKLLGCLLLVAAALLLPTGVPATQGLLLALPMLLTGLLTWFADEKRSDYYFALWADGVLLTQWLVAYLAAYHGGG